MEGKCLIAYFVSKAWQDKEDEECREVEDIKGNGCPDVRGGGHEVGDGLFHPGGSDLRDPNRVEGEEGKEGFEKEFDEHKIILSFLFEPFP